jgi:restriction system protein
MVREDAHGRDNAGAYAFTNVSGAIGTLKELELLDSSHTVDEIRQYLTVRYERRKEVNPAFFEQVVASVYRDIGYKNVRVTGRSNDGGIDIVMEGPNDSLVGVQVKRYKDKIEAEQIRAFTGALLLKDMTSGIFLTTSDYTRGAKRTATVAGQKGYRIELVDAYAFYDALGIAQRALYSGATDRTAPFPSAHMHHVDYKKVYLSQY